ncbi:MAG: dNTP triphosphohydrolase [Verrucomicrobiales bacterium]
MESSPRNQFYSAFDFETRGSRAAPAGEYRTPFEVDRDRIIHTAAFRRLQSKTQVFLSGEYDFYRTRLTHSIEVAQIGRSICTRLRRVSDLLGDSFFIDPDLVEAACLAHDLGHPPFGHTGERSLNRLMREFGGFEGNAQTLRMLTETIYGADRGMDPTRAFIDATLKYKSLHGELGEAPENHFLYDAQSDWLDFTLGGADFPPELPPGEARNAFRSIECQIMDWADDTAYSLNDLADGIQAGFITLERIWRWGEAQSLTDAQGEHLDKLCRAIREEKVEPRLGRRIGDFIAATSLREDANFMANLTRRYRYRLEIDPAMREEAELYKALALDIVFRSPQLQQLDHKAGQILERLFGAFADRYLGQKNKHRILPPAVQQSVEAEPAEAKRARLLCDYLAAMTDGFAARTYKRLFDADFGSIVDLV